MPTPSEHAALGRVGVDHPTVRSYLVWRRSALAAAAPIVALSAALATWGFTNVDTGPLFNELGVAAQVLPLLGPIVLLVAVVVALVRWTDARTGGRLLLVGWVLSLVLPLIPALLPIDWLIDRDELRLQLLFDRETEVLFLAFARLTLGVGYAVALLPVIVTFPGGVVRGSLRVKGLLPHSGFAGWFLVTTAPFYSVIVLVALTIIVQFFGTGLLVGGAALLALAPWVYVLQRRNFVGPSLGATAMRSLNLAQRVNSAMILGGVALVALWAFTAKVDGIAVVGTGEENPLNTLTVGRVAVETLGRVLVTTVVFAHVFASMTVSGRLLARSETSRQADADHDQKVDALADAFGMSERADDRSGGATPES